MHSMALVSLVFEEHFDRPLVEFLERLPYEAVADDALLPECDLLFDRPVRVVVDFFDRLPYEAVADDALLPYEAVPADDALLP